MYFKTYCNAVFMIGFKLSHESSHMICTLYLLFSNICMISRNEISGPSGNSSVFHHVLKLLVLYF